MEKTLFERYGHLTTILFIGFAIFIGIISIGCTRTEYINNTIIINNTIETIKEVKIPCNVTYIEDGCQYKKSYVLELIRRISFLEKHQDKWIMNETECIDNRTETNYKGKIEMYKRDIDELEEELENCEDELCDKWNSSWC